MKQHPLLISLACHLACLLGLGIALPLSAATPRLSLSGKGVIIDVGELGQLTLPPPALTMGAGDHSGQKPAVTLEGASVLLAKYPSGLQLRISLDGDAIRYAFSDRPADASGLRFTMTLPMSLNQGGRYDLGGKTGFFPEKLPDSQRIASGTADRLGIIYPLGPGIRLAVPSGYQQIDDNRKWNWSVFAWAYVYDFARHAKDSGFTFKISGIAADAVDGQTPRFLVDRYGQSARKDYPEKIKDDNELRADIARQKAALGSWQGPALDRFGGLAGSGQKLGLKKTGFFHTATIAPGRHVFVTPEGNAFFHLGVCCVGNGNDYTQVKGRERIYEWVPDPKDAAWRTAWRRERPDWGAFSFQVANWIRKYQKPYNQEEWIGQAVERLRAWGFNSIGAFSGYTPKMRELHIPTTMHLPNGKNHGVVYLPDTVGAGEVMDPFAPGTEQALERAYADSAVAKWSDDPLVIGWFLGNEQHFENLPRLILSYQAGKVAAKAGLVEMLREKYKSIAALNAAWEPAEPFAGFEDFGERQAFIRTAAAADDMRAFLRLYMEKYYGSISSAFRRHNKNHLLIGSRFTPHTANNEDVVRIAGKYMDVISVNYYVYGIEDAFLRKIYDWSGGRPLILSEWYYSSTERGLGAHREVRNQSERALGYRNYIEQSAATGIVIGSQWFIYTDQSITGRYFEGFNGEGNNTGLIDVADRPYEELVQAARLTHGRLYDVILGREKAFAWDDSRFSGKGSGPARVVAVSRALPGLQFDGSTVNWPGRPAESIGSSRIALGNPEPGLGGDFRLCWDDEALHFLIQVKDPSPGKNNRQPKLYWSADAVELFVGAKNLDQGGSLQFSDRHILLGAGVTPGVHVIDQPESVSQQCRVLVLRNVAGDGYTLQARIPWTVLGFRPEAGQELLFDVAIDNSDDGETRLQQLVWSGTDKNSGDRGSWGRARLVTN